MSTESGGPQLLCPACARAYSTFRSSLRFDNDGFSLRTPLRAVSALFADVRGVERRRGEVAVVFRDGRTVRIPGLVSDLDYVFHSVRQRLHRLSSRPERERWQPASIIPRRGTTRGSRGGLRARMPPFADQYPEDRPGRSMTAADPSRIPHPLQPRSRS